jgi:uncharacterized membrane protein
MFVPSDMALFPMHKWRLVGVVAILTFGLTAIAAILGAVGSIAAALFVTGFFLAIPLIALLGDDLPLVAAAEEDEHVEEPVHDDDPVDVLRERYARGELSEEEFESRLDRLLETEELSPDRSADDERELLVDEE